jgi:hypothetical protein
MKSTVTPASSTISSAAELASVLEPESAAKNSNVLNLILSGLQRDHDKAEAAAAAATPSTLSPKGSDAAATTALATIIAATSSQDTKDANTASAAITATSSNAPSAPAATKKQSPVTEPSASSPTSTTVPVPVSVPAPEAAASDLVVASDATASSSLAPVTLAQVESGFGKAASEITQVVGEFSKMLKILIDTLSTDKRLFPASSSAEEAALSTPALTQEDLKLVKAATVKEISEIVTRFNVSSQRNAVANNQSVVEATAKAVSQSVKGLVEAEVKKAVEEGLRSGPWRDEVRNHAHTHA